MKSSLIVAGALSVLAIISISSRQDAQSQDGEKDRVATIHHLMEGMHKSNMQRLAVASKRVPRSEDDWKRVEISAAVLNESSVLLTQNGRVADEVWETATGLMRSATADAVRAAEVQDHDAFKEAFTRIGVSCKTCHDKHKLF